MPTDFAFLEFLIKFINLNQILMRKKITVSLPLNISLDELHLFEPFSSYQPPSPKIRYIKGAFATSTGLVCGRKGLIKECVHHTWEQQFDVSLAQASAFYHDAQENPETMLVFDDDETYLLVHHPWHGNYYHWLTEAIFRIWMVKEKTSQMILLLPPLSQLPNIAIDSLKIFHFKNIINLSAKNSALIRTLCMPELKPDLACFNPAALQELRRMYLDHVRVVDKVTVNLGERIYLSRKKAQRRKIINEGAVIDTLTKYDFKIIYGEDYTFFEQVSLFSNARYLIAPHGAGLTNLLFMPAGSGVLEFHKRRTNSMRHHNLIFWYMADALGHKYYHQICEPENPDEHFHTADFTVDIDLLITNLDLMFMM